jgi:hypothetical protein
MSELVCAEPTGAGPSKAFVSFLTCTLRAEQPISKLRGLEHVLRHIWDLVCEEWLDLQLERFPLVSSTCGIVDLSHKWLNPSNRIQLLEPRKYPVSRQDCAGCPTAVLAKGLHFPSPQGLYINMMPIRLGDESSYPSALNGYMKIIHACMTFIKLTASKSKVGYITIDERIAEAGSSQRRPGLHVEAPGKLQCTYSGAEGRFVPGAEHGWGNGVMMRNEFMEGGIFMVSNVSHTTAVWNARVDNDHGVVGNHGDIEHLRGLLGPPSHLLEAGELVWMTDRTPHESLPVPAGVHRQYFRLVVGEVTAWFVDHSTANPLGTRPAPSTRIVRGDKFQLFATPRRPDYYATAGQIAAGYAQRQLYNLLCVNGLGHLYARFKAAGIRSVQDLVDSQLVLHDVLHSDAALARGIGYYDYPQLQKVVKLAQVCETIKSNGK